MTNDAIGTGSPAGPGHTPPLIPREILFGHPDRLAPDVSRDGTRIAFVAAYLGVLNVWVAPIDAMDRARPITRSTGRPIRVKFWAHTNTHIIYVADHDGREHWRVYAIDLATDRAIDLTPGVPREADRPGVLVSTAPSGAPAAPVQARLQAMSHRFPYEVLIAANA
jgi:hypothetical protein